MHQRRNAVISSSFASSGNVWKTISAPSHGGGQGFKSPRVHALFPWICRLNEKSERRRRHALGLWCSNPAEPPVATASPRPPSRPILNESTPCSPAFVRAKSLCYVRLRASFPYLPAAIEVAVYRIVQE